MSYLCSTAKPPRPFQFIVLTSALLSVVLPNIFFLLGWVQPLIGITLALMLFGATIYILAKSRETCRHDAKYTGKDLAALLVTILLTIIWVDLLGIYGHVAQCGDWVLHRTPIYSAFCKGNIPLFTSQGEYVVYYYAFWLPPSQLYRALNGLLSQETCLFIWYSGCLILAELLLFCRIKGRILTYMFILFFFGSLAHLWYGIIPLLPDVLHHLGYSLNGPLDLGLFSMARTHLQVSSNIVSGPNHGIPLVLAMAVIMSGLMPRRYNGFVAAMTIVCAPLNAIAILPLLLFDVWKERKHFVTHYLANIPLWIAACTLIPVAAFFMCQSASSSSLFIFNNFSPDFDYTWFHYHHAVFAHPWARILQGSVSVGVLLLPCYCLLKRRFRCTAYFICSAAIAVLVQFCCLGYHEFIFKGSMPIFMLLSMLFVHQLKRSTRRRTICIYLFIILSGPHVIGDVVHRHWWAYTWNPAAMKMNSIEGTLDTVHPLFRCENRFPSLLK